MQHVKSVVHRISKSVDQFCAEVVLLGEFLFLHVTNKHLCLKCFINVLLAYVVVYVIHIFDKDMSTNEYCHNIENVAILTDAPSLQLD